MSSGAQVVASGRHAVHLYRSNEELIGPLTTYLADALFAGGLAVAVATPRHREIIAERLVTTSGEAPAAGTVLLLDAQDLLERFIVEGRPDRRRFEESVGALVRTACAAVDPAESRRTPVHIFGEMVALLWADGRPGAAVELEELWGDLRRQLEFSLLCAYPSASVADPELADALCEVRRLHQDVLEPPVQEPACLPPSRERARPPPEQPTPAFRRSYAADVRAPRAARRFVTGVLVDLGDDRLAEDAGLVISELATNAVLHAATCFCVTVAVGAGAVQVAVRDDSPVVPSVRDLSLAARAASGRGLNLVAALTRNWGVEATGRGKVVWAELAQTRGVPGRRPGHESRPESVGSGV